MQRCPIGSYIGNKLSPLNALVRRLTGLARNITLVLLCTGGAVAEDDALGRAEALANRGSELEQQGRYDDAIPLTSDALAIREKMLGSDHPDVAKSLNNLAALYVEKGRFAEAEPLYQRSLAILEKVRGPENPDVASILDNLGNLYRAQGRYAEAETLVRRALAIRENAFGSEDPNIAKSLNNLASLAFAQGHYADAEPLFQRSLAIWEKALGTDHPEVANTLSNLAVLYDAEGRFDQAESLYRRSLAIREKALGPEHPDIADTLNNLAEVYAAQALYSEAEPLLMRSFAIREKALGPEHPKVAESLNNLAQLYFTQGRDAEAETFFGRSLAIYEKAVGPDHPDVAMSLSNLAAVYIGQGRFDAAEPLFRRSLAIREKALGPDHPDVAVSLNNLADVYRNTQRYGAPEPLYQRSAAIWEKAFGSEHPDLGRSLNNLAEVYRKNGRYEEAEPLFKRGLTIFEKALGEEHPIIALSLNNLAALYEDEGRDAEAEPLFKRSLAIDRKAFGARTPRYCPRFVEPGGALPQATTNYRGSQPSQRGDWHRSPLAGAGSALSGNGGTGDQREFRSLFLMSVALAGQQADAGPLPIGDSFRIAQLATASSTATAVAGMAARFAAGSDALAAAVRERQDLAQRWHGLDGAIVQAASKPPQQRDAAAEGSLRKELAETESRLDLLDTRIAREFSAYAELSNPEPLELAATQAMLSPDEALLVYLVGQDESWLWALRRDKAERYKLDIGATELSAEVAGLRERLDPDLNPDMLPFDAKRAHSLYEKILAPAATLLDGANQVFVIPDGALESLPMGVLVTRPPEHDPQGLGDYRDLSWFAREHALAVLPSVGALRELRQYSAAGHPAAAPFVGIGDPVLGGRLTSARGVKLATLFRGPLADTQAVRALPALPETADELRTVAKAMGAGEEDLYLAERASEPLLRKAGLDNYRVVEFATHGLISGDLKGLAEPALVLTPPEKPTSDNDGLLTASKIATFKLNADWVVLSACNTAAGDGTPDAGGLSGLAKGFFYAGARSILVSHWSVSSEATVKLITSTFAELQKDPAIGRAEALRRAEMAMLDPDNPSEFAHPLAWAPFVLAGEGGAGQ